MPIKPKIKTMASLALSLTTLTLATGCHTLGKDTGQHTTNADLAILVYGTTIDASREHSITFENVVTPSPDETPRNIISPFQKN